MSAPGIFDSVVQLIRPLMTPETRKSLRLMGTNKKQWQTELLKEIDADQLTPEFGGTKTYPEL
jgi:hypothetical protein